MTGSMNVAGAFLSISRIAPSGQNLGSGRRELLMEKYNADHT